MRTLLIVLGLVAAGATTGVAQRSWQAELGIQGGYARAKPAGTGVSDHTDLFNVPGGGFVSALVTYAPIYAIIPWTDRIAVEPTFGATQLQVPFLGGFSVVRLGLRGNYALTRSVYVGAGGVLNFLEVSGGGSDAQLGLQAGLGYRTRLSGRLNVRLEAQFVTTAKTDDIDPVNGYSAIFGVSTPIRQSGSTPAQRGARRGQGRAWEPAIGVAGGYASTHFVGQFDVASLTAPGLGGNFATFGAVIPGPATLFATFPIGTKLAFEPGLDLSRAQEGGLTIFSGNFGARLNYAVAGGWYAATGGNLLYLTGSGVEDTYLTKSISVLGAQLAWGYRFPLTTGLGGRFEVSYTMFPQNDDLGQASNTLGFMFGVTMPLK